MIVIEPIRNELYQLVSWRNAIAPTFISESVTSLGHIVELFKLKFTILTETHQFQYGNSEVHHGVRWELTHFLVRLHLGLLQTCGSVTVNLKAI